MTELMALASAGAPFLCLKLRTPLYPQSIKDALNPLQTSFRKPGSKKDEICVFLRALKYVER